MPANDERREVARRLREGMENRDDGFIDVVESAVFGDDLYHSSESTLERLADLMEPSEPKVKCVAEVKIDGEQLEQLVHDAAVELTGIDRDALLALADEIELRDGRSGLPCEECSAYRSPECDESCDPCELCFPRFAAKRIRELCGGSR